MMLWSLLGMAPLLSGCADGPLDSLDPGGPGAGALAGLGGFILVVCLITCVVMWLLILFIVIRRRSAATEDHAAVKTDRGGQRWIIIGGIIVPACVLSAMFVVGLRVMHLFPLAAASPTTPSIRVIGHRYWWEVEYPGRSPSDRLVSANELHVPAGQAVTIALESADVIHSFWIPRLHGKVDLIPGQVNHLRLQADRPEVYWGTCAEFCGAQHANMRLRLVSDTPEATAAWLAAQRLPAAVPRDPMAIKGQEVFLGHACALCHTVRGTPAHGTVGPDLTHVADRGGLGANMLPSSHAYFEAWSVRAQTFKPGIDMPNLGGLSGEELRALATYLHQLR